MNKKFRSVLLTILLSFTIILAGKVLADNASNSTDGKITVNKVASKDIGIDGNETYGRKSNVTLSVTGNEFTTSSSLDVVLVIDRSGSMNDYASDDDEQTKMQATKTSAVTLATSLLANNSNGRTVVKMGIVTFGSSIITDDGANFNSQSLTSTSLTSNVSTITSMINGIPDSVGKRGDDLGSQGTNIQSGLEKARELLASSSAKNKVVILLTDGKPTYFNYDGIRYGDGNHDGDKKDGVQYCVESTGHGPNYKCTKELIPSTAAKEEAELIKSDDIIIYTVGFGISDDTTTTNFLQSVASGAERAYLANNATELLNNFNDIVKSMTVIANDVVVEDIVPATFEVDVVALKNTYGDSVDVTYNEDDTTTITWYIGTLTVTSDPVLTYQVTARDKYYGGMYTNQTAVLTGTAVEGNPAYPDGDVEEIFPLPVVAIPAVTSNDNYSVKLGETLSVVPDNGISSNDINTKIEDGENTTVVDEIVIKSTTCGDIQDIIVNEDGSFEYTPDSSCYIDNNEVVFEYEVRSIVTIDGVEYVVISNTSTITIDITKDGSEVINPTVTKTNNGGETTTFVDGPFSYTINYSTIIENHIGSTVITVVDKLPYELDLTKENDLDDGIYDSISKTITWVEVFDNIDSYKNQNNSINIEKNIKVFYKNVPTDIEEIKNIASVSTDIDNKPVEVEENIEVVRGTVTSEYIDTLGNVLLDSITTKGLIDSDYFTNANNLVVVDGVEYHLVATKVNGSEVDKTNNYSGKYTLEDTLVTYIYYKVTGDIDEEQATFTKEGPNTVTTTDSVFDYKITYNNKIDNYIGDAKVTIIDYLPFELDLTKAYDLDGGIYDATSKTITWVDTINNIDTYTNGTYLVNIEKNIKVVFKGINATDRELVNDVYAKLETSKSNSEDDAEEKTELAIKGYVVAHYVDVNNNKIDEDYNDSDLVGNEYTTSARDITGYKLVEVIGNSTGIYVDGTVEVTYVYYKVEGNISDDSIVKDGTNKVTSTDEMFTYDVTYNAVIKNYIGNAKVTIVDTLPYELDLTKEYDLDGGIYDANSKTITWTDTINNIDTSNNEPYLIEIVKNIKFSYKGMEPTVRVVTNSVVGTIETEVTKETTEPYDKETAVEVTGNVVAEYIDTLGNTLESSVTTSGLVGDIYTTSAKTIDGYKLVEVRGNVTGNYTVETINVTYVYYRVEGNIDKNLIVKDGTDEVTSVDALFEYDITYKTVINDYIGDAEVTIIDTLPYELDLTKEYDLDGGIYDATSKTITWVETIEDIDTNNNGEYLVEFVKHVKVVYAGIKPDTRKVTNTVIGKIKTDVKESTTEPENKETLVKVSGDVIANYVDTNGNVISESVKMSGLVGDSYVTSSKSIDGYELVEIEGNTTGKYMADTINVTYIYYRETGEVVGDSIIKEGSSEVFSTDALFEYKISYNAIVKNYIGNAEVIVVDYLPYELDLTKEYDLDGGIYDATNRTITWIEVIENINTNNDGEYLVEVIKNIKVSYKGIDPTTRTIINKAIGTVKTDFSEKTTDPASKDTSLKVYGDVIANYVDTDGNVISDSVKVSGLVGNEYVTNSKIIDNYELVRVNGSTVGKYTVETINVTYIYYKNTGNISNDSIEKVGSKEINNSDDKVNYTINYNAIISKYIGNAEITIIDYLPYKLDLSSSDIAGGTYNESDLTITWVITLKDIDTYTNGAYNIDITKELLLSYMDIDLTSDVITNKVSGTIKTDVSEKTGNDSFETKVNVNGTVEVNYVDELGNKLRDSILLSGKVGSTYKTKELAFDDYILVNVIGEQNGEYIDGKKVVTYVYATVGKGGDVEVLPPQTGANVNNFVSLIIGFIIGVSVILRKFI